MAVNYLDQTLYPLKLTDAVTLVGNYYFNIILVRGEQKSALFETGVSAIADTVISQLTHLGPAPDYIISAHPHSDHITGLPALMERFTGSEVITGEGARAFVEHPKAGPLMLIEDAFIAKRLTQEGITPGRPPLDRIPDLSGASAVSARRSIHLGGVTLELIKVGGHSPGNLICHIPEEGIVLASDSLGFHYPGRGFYPLFFTGLSDYMDTFNLIKSLDPVMICPAHQGPIKGDRVIPALIQSFEATQAVIRLVREEKEPLDELEARMFKESYVDEFTLYTEENIRNCANLLIKRVRETDQEFRLDF